MRPRKSARRSSPQSAQMSSPQPSEESDEEQEQLLSEVQDEHSEVAEEELLQVLRSLIEGEIHSALGSDSEITHPGPIAELETHDWDEVLDAYRKICPFLIVCLKAAFLQGPDLFTITDDRVKPVMGVMLSLIFYMLRPEEHSSTPQYLSSLLECLQKWNVEAMQEDKVTETQEETILVQLAQPEEIEKNEESEEEEKDINNLSLEVEAPEEIAELEVPEETAEDEGPSETELEIIPENMIDSQLPIDAHVSMESRVQVLVETQVPLDSHVLMESHIPLESQVPNDSQDTIDSPIPMESEDPVMEEGETFEDMESQIPVESEIPVESHVHLGVQDLQELGHTLVPEKGDEPVYVQTTVSRSDETEQQIILVMSQADANAAYNIPGSDVMFVQENDALIGPNGSHIIIKPEMTQDDPALQSAVATIVELEEALPALKAGDDMESKSLFEFTQPEGDIALPEGLIFGNPDPLDVEPKSGIWATRFLPMGAQIGPYDSDCLNEICTSDWPLPLHVTCLETDSNIKAVKITDKIYYQTEKDIDSGQELVTWRHLDIYNASYGRGRCSECHFMPAPKVTKISDALGNVLFCDVCGKTFNKLSTLQKHSLIHSSERPFSCYVCDKKFTTDANLQAHVKLHTTEKKYACELCSRRFHKISQLKYHVRRTHENERPYTCQVCQKSFHTPCNLERHMQSHEKGKSHECQECSQNFVSLKDLYTHMQTHPGYEPSTLIAMDVTAEEEKKPLEWPHVCEECNKRFETKNKLKDHERLHKLEYNEICEVCGRKFSREAYLKAHMRTHTDERPYVCEVCSKSFRQKNHLDTHTRTHTGAKPYVCPVCHRGYARKADMKVHIFVHTREKPYACTTCGKAYNQRSVLRRHKCEISN